MIHAAALALLLFAPARPPVAIYVGPLVRDGFADVDRGVTDSIKDLRHHLQSEIGKKRARFVDDEKTADVKVYVVGRGTTESASTTTTGAVIGNVGVATSAPDNLKRLDIRLRAGTYERGFVAEKGSWSDLSLRIAKDISAWLEANHARVLSRP